MCFAQKRLYNCAQHKRHIEHTLAQNTHADTQHAFNISLSTNTARGCRAFTATPPGLIFGGSVGVGWQLIVIFDA